MTQNNVTVEELTMVGVGRRPVFPLSPVSLSAVNFLQRNGHSFAKIYLCSLSFIPVASLFRWPTLTFQLGRQENLAVKTLFFLDTWTNVLSWSANKKTIIILKAGHRIALESLSP